MSEMWPLSISCRVPLYEHKSRVQNERERAYSGRTTGGQSSSACTNTGRVTSGELTAYVVKRKNENEKDELMGGM